MNEKENKNLRTYCAFLLTEHHLQFSPSDPVIPALYIIHQEMKQNRESNDALAQSVRHALAKVNPRLYQFNAPGEAWKFQLAIAAKWVIIGVLAVFAIGSIVWYESLKRDTEKAKQILNASQSLEELVKYMKQDSDGRYFVDLAAGKGDSIQSFTQYKRISPKVIRVYLGKDKE